MKSNFKNVQLTRLALTDACLLCGTIMLIFALLFLNLLSIC
jgi:hypothetical protein